LAVHFAGADGGGGGGKMGNAEGGGGEHAWVGTFIYIIY
jgi:hypothetical protein